MNDNSARASIAVIVGATGSGKSSGIVCTLRDSAPDRLMIFDPGEDYTQLGTAFRDTRELYRHLVTAGPGPFAAVLVPRLDTARERGQFDEFCRLAFTVGRVAVVADELSDVMTATWAPEWWHMLVRKGRKRGVRLIGATQRPARLEKGIWSFATVVRSGVLDYHEDAAEVAARLRVTADDILALPSLHWIQWVRERRAIVRGHIEFRAGRPHEVVDSENIFSPPGAIRPGSNVTLRNR